MGKYKVNYSGFVYVEADSEDDAINMAQDDDTVYEEKNWGNATSVEEFIVEW